jgi:DNA-3-methyladenine glycosylase I
MSYCSFCQHQPIDSLHRSYHDFHYGFPLACDNALFGRLILEINQAGLTWETILRKEQHYREAFDGFCVSKIAKYDEEKIKELMLNPGIVRNKKKIESVVHNAKQVIQIQQQTGSFQAWLVEKGELSLEEWVMVFKKEFKFVGREIVVEFLMSSGYLKGAHDKTCPVYDEILNLEPNWLRYEK